MKNLLLFSLLGLSISACQQKVKEITPSTAYIGATIIDGSGSAPINDGVLLISDGKVVATGTRTDVKIPDGAIINDVSGKFIIPGLINTHGHVGGRQGVSEGGNYSREKCS